MKNTTKQRMEILQQAGVDTSNFVLNVGNLKITIEEDAEASKYVSGKQGKQGRLFRRWVMAQTFSMLADPKGWDNALRQRYDYMYQFELLENEAEVLMKLDCKDKEAFKIRSTFFSKKVFAKTCEDYVYKLNNYIELNQVYSKKKRAHIISFYGRRMKKLDVKKVNEDAQKMASLVYDMKCAEDYAELFALMRKFNRLSYRLPNETAKCKAWKDAFKGSGAYYTLQNMILYHDVLLPFQDNKEESMQLLNTFLELYKYDLWKFNMLLKKVIKINNFDIRKSIEEHK